MHPRLCATFENAAHLCGRIDRSRRSGLQIVRVARAIRTPVFGLRVVCARRAICEPFRQQTADSNASL
eukprot:1505224-Lingulodinium_polyedra.AAC.1